MMDISTTYSFNKREQSHKMEVKGFFYTLLNAGMDREQGLEAKYKRQSLNSFPFILILITFPYFFIFGFSHLWYPLAVVCFIQLLFLFIIGLNYWGRYELANYVLIFTTNSGILLMSYLVGFSSGFHLFLYTAPLYIFWIYDLTQVRSIVIAIVIDVVYYVLIYFLKVNGIQLHELDQFAGVELYTINLFLNLGLMFLLFYNYTEYYKILTDTLVQKRNELSEEVIRREESEKHTNRLFEDLSVSYKNLEQFSFIISHNVRSPLSNMKGFLSLYEEDGHNPENDAVVQSIREAAEHLDTVLMDLNVLLNAKNLLLENKASVNLAEAVENVGVSLSSDILTSGAIIKEDFDPGLTIVTVKTILHSILFNLLQNAIRYSKPDEHPEISIKAIKTDSYTEIRVSDNGMGIDLNKYGDRVFTLYSRFTNSKEGKGIGLYLVKSSIEMLGGKIRIESKLNHGTTFIITLQNN